MALILPFSFGSIEAVAERNNWVHISTLCVDIFHLFEICIADSTAMAHHQNQQQKQQPWQRIDHCSQRAGEGGPTNHRAINIINYIWRSEYFSNVPPYIFVRVQQFLHNYFHRESYKKL